jgi:hypothetical protein
VLLRALAEFLLADEAGTCLSGPYYSSLPANSPLAHLADKFADDLKAIGMEIETRARARDVMGVRRRCLKIISSAPALGFTPVAKLAEAALAALDASMSIDESAGPIGVLIVACQSVRRTTTNTAAA